MQNEELKKTAESKLGLSAKSGQIELNGKSLLASMGGWLGVVESILPSLIFGASYAIISEPLISVSLAAASSLVFILVRIFTRQSPSSAIVGALAVGFAAWLALREGGQAVDYFVPGFITNAVYAVVLTVSILLRWPIIGILVEVLLGRDTSWRKSKSKLATYSSITGLWVGFFLLRLLVQVPLYLASQVELLAAARIIMGPPMYALLIVITWLILRATVLKKV